MRARVCVWGGGCEGDRGSSGAAPYIVGYLVRPLGLHLQPLLDAWAKHVAQEVVVCVYVERMAGYLARAY